MGGMASSHRGDAMPPTGVSEASSMPSSASGASTAFTTTPLTMPLTTTPAPPKVQEIAVIRRFRAWRARHTLLIDGLLALFVLGPGLLIVAQGYQWGPLAFTLHLLMCVPLMWRRRSPSLVFLTVAAIELISLLLEVRSTGIPLGVACYTVIVHDRARYAFVAVGGLFGLAIAREAAWPMGGTLLQEVFSVLLLNGFVCLLGFTVRTRRAHLAALEDRAARLEVERDHQAQLAAAGERARIAREMHDIVAHNLAMMISLADGATAALRSRPDRALTALDALSSTGRQALDELRRVLGVLRGDQSDAERMPQPALADMEQLVERIRAAGLPVGFTVRGQVDRLPESAQLAVYRLVQESLTNALKHGGPGAIADVTVDYASTGVDITVVNSGLSPGGPGLGGGHGLVGMRERVAVYGGAVEAGPRAGGGWRVHATIPADAGGRTRTDRAVAEADGGGGSGSSGGSGSGSADGDGEDANRLDRR